MSKGPDFTQVARRMVDQATGEGKDKRRNPAAVELGKLGGKAKGENARARREAAQREAETA